MPYSRKRKTYSRRGAATGATRALTAVARAMNAPYKADAKKRNALKRGVRQKLWEQAKMLDATQFNTLMKDVPHYNEYDQAKILQIMGKGGYWGRRFGSWLGGLTGNDTIKGWMGGLGDKLGDVVADAVPYGNQIAHAAEGLAHMSGHGAYHMGDGPGTALQVGTFSTGDVERVNIKSREYLGAINGASTFTLSSLVLNPGLVQTFPQLSKLAMHYEQYQLNGCVFWFHSTSGESTNSADTAIGELMMANQPDSSEPNPINKQQMVRLDSAKQAKPSIDQLHGIECADAPIKFIRHGDPLESTQDPNRYDLGKFHLAVEGCNAAVTRIGELWVTYDIDLIRSRDSKGQEVASFRADTSSGSAIATNLFTNTPMQIRYNSLPIILGAGNTLTFPQFVCDGDYQISLQLFGNASTGTTFFQRAPSISSIANGTLICNYSSYQLCNAANAANASDDREMGIYCIRVNAPGASQCAVTFDNSSLWPSTGASTPSGFLRLIITRIPQDLYAP